MAAVKSLLRIVLAALALAGCGTFPGQAPAENIFIDSEGSGFFITGDGYVVTSAHVVEGARSIGVWVGNDRHPARIVAISPETDVAILKIDHRPARFFRLANFDLAMRADRVFALGFPLTGTLTSEIRVTDGIISAFSGTDGDPALFQISAPVQPGNSGGPIVNERLEVLGVVASKLTGGDVDNVSFGVKNAHVISLLPQGAGLSAGNVRSMRDAERATVPITVNDIYDGPPVVIVNDTGFSVSSVYLSPSSWETWGRNRLSPGQSLESGESISLDLPLPLDLWSVYDIMLVDLNGEAHIRWDAQVGADSKIVFASETEGRLRGTFYFNSYLYITFEGDGFIETSPLGEESGSFRVSGDSVIFSTSMFGSDTWEILDSSTLRDPEGDLWTKPESAAPHLSGAYHFSQGLYIAFSGNKFTLSGLSTGPDSGTYRVSGNEVVFSASMWGSDTWEIVDSNTLRDPDGDLWSRR